MSETPAVQVNSLVKDFRGAFGRGMIRAVDEVSLEIGAGEVYGLIGPNGSGKSTTMKALLGLVTPTSGTCAIFGRDSSKVDSRQEVHISDTGFQEAGDIFQDVVHHIPSPAFA